MNQFKSEFEGKNTEIPRCNFFLIWPIYFNVQFLKENSIKDENKLNVQKRTRTPGSSFARVSLVETVPLVGMRQGKSALT